MVTQVLPNGNLVIQGQKRLSLSEGSETVKVEGVVAREDVQPDNTVLSSRIAGAQISYLGSGELAEFAKVNWGTRFFNKVWPFEDENNEKMLNPFRILIALIIRCSRTARLQTV